MWNQIRKRSRGITYIVRQTAMQGKPKGCAKSVWPVSACWIQGARWYDAQCRPLKIAFLHYFHVRYPACNLKGNPFHKVAGAFVDKSSHQTRFLLENALVTTFGLSLLCHLPLRACNASPPSRDLSSHASYRWFRERMTTAVVNSLLIMVAGMAYVPTVDYAVICTC